MNAILNELEKVISARQKKSDPGSYTCRLLSEENLILRKLSEEAYEVVEAAFSNDRAALLYESCDLLYHFLVLLCKYGISLNELEEELKRRRRNENG